MGRLRHRHARRRGRRRDDNRGHAAQQHSGNDDRRGAPQEAAGCARTVSRRRRVLGRRRAGQAGSNSMRSSMPAFADSNAFLRRQASTSFLRSTRTICAPRCRSSRGGASRCSCMPNYPQFFSSMAAGATHSTYQSYLSTRPPEAEVAAIDLMVAARRPSFTRGFTSSMWRAPRQSRPLRAPGGGRVDHRRDLPALPDLFGGRDSRTARPSSSARRQFATRGIATRCGRRWLASGRDRSDRDRPFAVAAQR